MIIECEMCGSATIMDKAPRNNYCPICLHIGSLFIQKSPDEKIIKELTELFGKEKVNANI